MIDGAILGRILKLNNTAENNAENIGVLKRAFRTARNACVGLALCAAALSPQNAASATKGYDATYVVDTWAGVVAATSISHPKPKVTGIGGTWTVPRIKEGCKGTDNLDPSTNPDNSYDLSEWVGIGGVRDPTLIQIGIDENIDGGEYSYNAFYELVVKDKDTQVTIPNFIVEPGDRIYANISLVNSKKNQWRLYLRNLSRDQPPFSRVVTFDSSRLTAEWIAERPRTMDYTHFWKLPRFGVARFTYGGPALGNYARIGNVTGPISMFHREAVEMQNPNSDFTVARPSNLDSAGNSFDIIQDECR